MTYSSTSSGFNAQEHADLRATLNRLISINRDGAEGYKKAAELLAENQYKEICLEYAEQRERFIVELTHLMNSFGDRPTDSQSAAGVLHDLWMDIRNMVGGDDADILAECDRGEEAAVEFYHETLMEDLPEEVDALLRAQFSLLKGAHERIHRLATALEQ